MRKTNETTNISLRHIFNKYFLFMILILLFSSFSSISGYATDSIGNNNSKINSTNSLNVDMKYINKSLSVKNDNDLLNLKQQYNLAGTGTKTSPIIIENFNISITNLVTPFKAIDIENTNLYFIIRQNIINTTSLANSFSQYAIFLNNTLNGRIFDNNLTSTQFKGYGLYIENSNTQVTNNIINNYYQGLIVKNSNVTITNNLFENSVIAASVSNILSTLNNKKVFWNILFENNNFFHSSTGLILKGTELFPIQYKISLKGNIFEANVNGSDISSYGVTLSDNYFFKNSGFALQLMRSLNSNITNNKFDHNRVGISINSPNYSPKFNSINCGLNPLIPECKEPIINNTLLLHYSNITIDNNIISNQTSYGLYISANCDYNTIIENNILNNSIQAQQESKTNFWSNNKKGNYWSDYTGKDKNNDGIGDTPYVINNNGEDTKPLMAEESIQINNSAIVQIRLVSPDIVHSFIYYSIFIGPIIALAIVTVIGAIIYKYKKYITTLSSSQEKLTFSKYFKKQIKLKPKEKSGAIHADKALQMLEEIMNETNKE